NRRRFMIESRPRRGGRRREAAPTTASAPGTLASPTLARGRDVPQSRPLLRRAQAGRRHLEGKVEDRQVFARMVLVAGQLRQAVVDRPRLLALVDRRIKIDVVPAGLAGRLHDDLDVALAVEAACIAGKA